MSWIDYEGRCIPRRSLAPGACYFERSFATHPWLIETTGKSRSRLTDDVCSGNVRAEKMGCRDGGEKIGSSHAPNSILEEKSCCVIRVGAALAVARLTVSLIWNPEGKTVSLTKQVKYEAPGTSASVLAAASTAAAEGVGIDPGKKRLCLAGGETSAEIARAAAGRAAVREEKARILEEMRTCRTYPLDSVEVDGCTTSDRRAAAGLSQGAPNLRVTMIGSATWNRARTNDVNQRESDGRSITQSE